MSDVSTHGGIRGKRVQGTPIFSPYPKTADVWTWSSRASSPFRPRTMAKTSNITSQREPHFKGLGTHSFMRCRRAYPPAYNNSQLITAFSQSFLSVVRSMDPNDKFYTDLKPEWSVWQNGTTEMLFNVTSTGGAVVHTTKTDPALLERCA